MTLAYVPFRHCSRALPALAPSTLVLVYIPHDVPIHQIEADARCLEDIGAEVVLVMHKHHKFPSHMTYTWDWSMAYDVTIPVFAVADSACTQSVLTALQRNESMTIQAVLQLNPNHWKDEFFNSPAFFVLFRVGIPVLSLASLWIACDGVVGHASILRANRNSPSMLALAGCVAIIISSLLRIAFFLIGPFRSSTNLSFEAHAYLFNTILGVTAFISFIAAGLMFQWGSFGRRKGVLPRREIMAVSGGVVAFVLTEVFAVLQVAFLGVGSLGIEPLAWLLMAVSTILICITFWVAGVVFVRRLAKRTTSTKGSWRTKALNKAIFWIMTAAVAQLFEATGGLLAASSPRLRYTPWTMFVCLALIFYGLSMAAVAHALAFRPIAAKRVTIMNLASQLWLPRQQTEIIRGPSMKCSPMVMFGKEPEAVV